MNILKKIIILGEILLPFVFSYVCQRLSIGRGYEFTTINPYILLINYLLWASLFLFFVALFKKNYRSLFLYLVFFIFFSLANRYKMKLLTQPVQIGDISFFKEALGVIPFIKGNPTIRKEFFIFIIGTILAFFIIKKAVKLKVKNIFLRLSFLIISLFIISFPFFFSEKFNQLLVKTNIVFNQWDQYQNCRNNGMLLCFVYDLQFFHHTPPKDYNQESINRIYQSIKQSTIDNKENNIKPNVILILSEALWDSTQLPQTKLSIDPIPNIRNDIKGGLVSPTFGGQTANIEFEILTGLSNYLFQKNSYPYTEFIRHPTPSLFTVFKDNGYTTTTIHPYSSWTYNRQNVYKNFSLDKFTNLSNMSNYETLGPFVSDKSFTQEIINQFNSTDQPQFIFALSIQNHAPYEPNRFKDQKIKITSSLDKNDKSVIQSYIEGTYLSDQYYQSLKNIIQKSNKPTVIILFGDHLPFLGNNFDIYKKVGFVPNQEDQWTDLDNFKIHTTPISIWNNFDQKINSIGNVSPNFLSNIILDLASIQPEYQFKFTDKIRNNISYLTKKVSSNISTQSASLNDYNLIQHDLLFGKQYTRNFK